MGEDPILLFDDVMSELDERRREYLAEYFLESTQAVITTTNLEYFDDEILRRARIIRISGGSILETATVVSGRSTIPAKQAYISVKWADGASGKSQRMCYNHRVQSL